MRRWRKARDAGRPVQPSLARGMVRMRSAILAPTLDSLLKFYELALGRRIAIGKTRDLSDDETLLLQLVADTRRPSPSLGGGEAAGSRLDQALRSARIMLGLAMADEALAASPA